MLDPAIAHLDFVDGVRRPITSRSAGRVDDSSSGNTGNGKGAITFDLRPKRRVALVAAVKSYKPKTQSRIDDLDAPVSSML